MLHIMILYISAQLVGTDPGGGLAPLGSNFFFFSYYIFNFFSCVHRARKLDYQYAFFRSNYVS